METPDHLLDVVRARGDVLEPFTGDRSGLGVAEKELRQREDCEERVVDLVNGAGGELAGDRQPPALDEAGDGGRSRGRHRLNVGSARALRHPLSRVRPLTRIGERWHLLAEPFDAARLLACVDDALAAPEPRRTT